MKQIRIALTENDFKALVRGDSVVQVVGQGPGFEVRIILNDIGFGAMHWAVGDAMVASAEQTGPESLGAFEKGETDHRILDRLAHADGEAPINTRLTPAQNAALTVGLETIVATTISKRYPDEFKALGGAMYGFQLGHDYALAFGDITRPEKRS